MNKYKTLEVLGEGTYGIVIKCKNKNTGEIFAIKKFKDADATNKRINSASMRELKLVRSLQHENIVKTMEAFKKKGKLCIVFEYMNKSLLQLIEESEKGLPSEKNKSYTFQLCKAIQYCHDKDIIHRDIKPENILINEKGTLKLCDFGFARNLMHLNDKMTEYVATRWYRAPELLLGESYGKPVDIWSIGCIVGEMGNREALFPGKSEIDQMYLIQKVLGPLPPSMVKTFLGNQKSTGWNFPSSEFTASLDLKYKGIINPSLISFMKETLGLHPSNRLTAEECLDHLAFKFESQIYNCSGHFSGKTQGIKVKLMKKHKFVLPPVKFVGESHAKSERQKNLTINNDGDPTVKRSFNFLHCSPTCQRHGKLVEDRELFPLMNLINESNNNKNVNKAETSFGVNKQGQKFKGLNASNKRSMLDESSDNLPDFKSVKTLQNKSRECKQHHLDKSETTDDKIDAIKLVALGSKTNSYLSKSYGKFQKFKNEKNCKRSNNGGCFNFGQSLKNKNNSSSISDEKAENYVGPCVTPNSQFSENLDSPKAKSQDIYSESQTSQHVKICQSINKNPKRVFRLEPIVQTNFSLTSTKVASSIIPVSSKFKVIKSSSCTCTGPQNELNKVSKACQDLKSPATKYYNSALLMNGSLPTSSKEANVAKHGLHLKRQTYSPKVCCRSRIPLAVRDRRDTQHNALLGNITKGHKGNHNPVHLIYKSKQRNGKEAGDSGASGANDQNTDILRLRI